MRGDGSRGRACYAVVAVAIVCGWRGGWRGGGGVRGWVA